MWDEAKRQESLRADSAWQAELERQFGKHAGDVRYTAAGRGDVGSELRRLHDAWMAANEAWRVTIRHGAGEAAGGAA